MHGWHSKIRIYRHRVDCLIYLQVVTYANDGHFYYKRYPRGMEWDYKFRRIRKKELQDMLKDYEYVSDITNSI